jgi:hypothetical protein
MVCADRGIGGSLGFDVPVARVWLRTGSIGQGGSLVACSIVERPGKIVSLVDPVVCRCQAFKVSDVLCLIPLVLSSHDGAPENVAEDKLLVLMSRNLVLIPQDGARLDTKKSCLCSQIITPRHLEVRVTGQRARPPIQRARHLHSLRPCSDRTIAQLYSAHSPDPLCSPET